MRRVVRHAVIFCLLLAAGCGIHRVEPVEPSHGPIPANDPRGVWLVIHPTQCSITGPWREDWVATHGEDYPFGEGEISILQEYCSKRGITVHDVATRRDDRARCAACTCQAHYNLFLLVSLTDADAVIEFGGSPMRPDE